MLLNLETTSGLSILFQGIISLPHTMVYNKRDKHALELRINVH